MKRHYSHVVLLLSVIVSFFVSGCATTQLHNAIMQNNTKKAILLTQDENVKINKANGKGQTALMLAAIRVQEDVVNALLDRGADPNIPNPSGITALTEAVYKGYPPIVENLLTHGANINQADKDNWPALMYAIQQNYYPIVKLLIKKGADINHSSNTGLTPLQYAAKEGNTTISGLLIEKGALLDKADNTGMTPLMNAVMGGHAKIVDMLLAKGADTNLVSKDNKTAKDMAVENGLTEIEALFDESKNRPLHHSLASKNNPGMIIKPVKGWIGEGELSPGSLRAMELRNATGHFLDLLCESGVCDHVDTADETTENGHSLVLDLTVKEVEDLHRGKNATKAFLSGFLTLGLVPPSANYSYQSTMTLKVDYPDGTSREYTSSSDTSTKWSGDPRLKSYVQKAGGAQKAARRLVTHQALEELVLKLKESSNSGDTP